MHQVAGSSKSKPSFKNKKGEPARNICAAQYNSVLRETLLPGGQRLFSGQGISCWTLQQDGDPAHVDAPGVVEEWSKKNKSNARLLQIGLPTHHISILLRMSGLRASEI